MEREQILQTYRRSGLTQKQFANQFGLGLSTLQSWLRKTARPVRSLGAGFVAVPNLLSAAPTPAAYRLRLPGGKDLEIRAGFDLEELAALLELLGGI